MKRVIWILLSLVALGALAFANRYEAAGCVQVPDSRVRDGPSGPVSGSHTDCYIRDRWTGRIEVVEPE